ncbi:MAG: DNA polymerase III subunit delta' [Rhodobacteraceae bacterium]|nr:DNA polymerase III subunit delta' [Paracoccaceae bacterium]MBR28557.1 DNA polymerase III subunit delta' [Paracoccaceae bacterium]
MARKPFEGEVETPPEADRVEGAPHPRETPVLFGQEAAEAAFLDAWAGGRLHHAWMLTGPRGVGKATLAWRMARALIAQPAPAPGLFGAEVEEPPAPATLEMEPDAPAFRRLMALSEPRLRLLRRSWDDKTKRLRTRIVAEDARALHGLFANTAADGGWRVAVIDALDDLNPQAANALLKLIEEPPERSIFLLVCHAPSRILPTIRSRCRALALRPLDPPALSAAVAAAQTTEAAKAGQGAPEAHPAEAALHALSDGSAGEALRLAAEGGPELYARLVRLAQGAPGMDRAAFHDWASAAAGRDAEARFDATLRLVGLLTSRLARAGAGRPPDPEAAPGEAALAARLSPSPAAARAWAEAAQDIPARAARARAVNLDPERIILDTFGALDAAARRAAGG